MDLKAKVKVQLLADASHSELVDIVQRYKEKGGTQREAYDQLHELWMELGFDEDESDQPNTKRDELEYLMELVWGFCSSDKSLWETSLSGS